MPGSEFELVSPSDERFPVTRRGSAHAETKDYRLAQISGFEPSTPCIYDPLFREGT
jgi:hypothetical protein